MNRDFNIIPRQPFSLEYEMGRADFLSKCIRLEFVCIMLQIFSEEKVSTSPCFVHVLVIKIQ